MSDTHTHLLLAQDERPAAAVLNPGGTSPVVLVCEHASAAIPVALGDLGLAAAARFSHAAWDIGALDVARAMSAAMDAVLVVSRVSRLVYDCNRPPEDDTAVPVRSEVIEVPGNRGLTSGARSVRVAEVYAPFRDLLAEVLDDRAGGPTTLVTIHSFTPVFNGLRREVELGYLHDASPGLARRMLAKSQETGRYRAELNAPYDASDGVTHTLRAHAEPRGIDSVMIEIRNDLVDTADGAAAMAAHLVVVTQSVLAGEGAS